MSSGAPTIYAPWRLVCASWPYSGNRNSSERLSMVFSKAA